MSIKSKKTVYADSVIYKSESTSAGSWSEWLDSELNSEPWDYPKSGEFTDPQQVEMPASLQPTKWKRFENVRNVITPTVFEPIVNYPDLIVNNRHILHSEFVRCFISTLINIQYCGRNGLQIENPSNNFSWNFVDQCWQGWHHVYSLNKAGKGVPHSPLYNPKGRYVVRLFLMGLWRRILIDDLIPVDKRGRPLLPRTANIDELWPLLLAKAMLKVAALSWTPKREIVNCSLITCLTGWIDLSLNVSHLSARDQWELLTKYTKHFEWLQEEKTEDAARTSKNLGKESKRKSKGKVKKIQVPEEPQPTLLFLSLEDMRDVDAEEIPGITPCWNHQIYVELARDLPLDPAQVKPPLAKWKLHRWLDWATSRGLINASEYFVPIRHLLIVSPLRQCKGDIGYAYDQKDDEDYEEDSSQTTVELKAQAPGKIRSSATTGSSKDKRRSWSLPDISLWGDFNKLSPYLREIHLFYRKKFFKYSIEVSDIVQNISWNDARRGKSEATTGDSKKSGKSMSPRLSAQAKSYEYQDRVSQSRNEPLYLLVDSTENKFFLVNFSTMVQPQNSSMISQPRRNSSLVVERHDWFRTSVENELVTEVKTRGTKSTVFQLEPGRHLLRLFLSSESSYHVAIFSDTPFQIGNRRKIHDLMTTESESVCVVAQKISTAVKKAFESFGSANYAADLKFFYQSYMPDLSQPAENVDKKVLKSIHSHFSEEFAKLLEKRFPASELPMIRRALRIFFVDPSLGRKAEQLHYFQHRESLENIEGAEWNENRSATIVQSFFRMIWVKRYREIHETSHKEHNRVKEALLSVVELFNYDKHESAAEILLRAVVKRDTIYKSLYACANDFKHVIQIQELRGRIFNVQPDQWVPIVRVLLNAPRWKSVLAVSNLFTNLPNYTLRAFANDTKREMLRTTNNVEPLTYRYRKSGYTIFAYGRSDVRRLRELEWSLQLVTMKGEAMLHFLDEAEPITIKSDISPLTIQEIANNYIPNIRNRILKLVVRTKLKCLLSLRLQTSYQSVMTKLRVVSEAGESVAEVEGGSTVILPLVFLEQADSNEKEIPLESEEKMRRSKKRSSTARSGGSLSNRSGFDSKRISKADNQDTESCRQYLIEGFVREDSWPLTEAEWAVVAEAKSRSSSHNTALRRSSTLGKVSRNEKSRSKQLSRKSLELHDVMEKPYWILQVVTDGGSGVEVFEDTSKEDRMRELKRLWKTEESGRSQRGNELRERFLEDNCLVIARSEIEISSSSIADDDDDRLIESVDEFYEETSQAEKRTLDPPADLGNYLPKLDLSIYMVKDDEEEESWLKSEFDEETLRNRRAMNVLDFEQLRAVFLEEAAELVKKRRDKYRRLSERHLENSGKRVRVVDEAYELRRGYIEATKKRNTARSVKSRDSKENK